MSIFNKLDKTVNDFFQASDDFIASQKELTTIHKQERGNKLYLVEPINSEFVRLTPLFKGETFERGIEDYYMTVNRFENNNKTQWKK